jgi:uncharacterized membrane protein
MTTTNPYAAPKAPVADAASRRQGNFVPGGRPVPAAHGWDWIAEAWNLFKRQPGIWVVIAVLWVVIFVALSLIPVLGTLVNSLLTPVFVAGFVIGANALDEGRELQVGHLFAGFSNRFGTLISVGALYLAASVAIVVVSALLTGASAWVMLGGSPDPVGGTMGAMTTILLAWLVMLGLMVPVLMAVWFAPALVVFHQRGAVEAMKESFSGCLKNIVPFLVYGVIGFVLAIVAAIPIGLGWLVLLPVLGASAYTAYRDIYFTS